MSELFGSLDQLRHMYVNEMLSTYQIAEKLRSTPYQVRKALLHAGVELRSRGEATKVALDSGRMKHPTRGRKRTSREKDVISIEVQKSWSKKPADKRESHAKLARERYAGLGEGGQQRLQKMAGDGIREAARKGSRLERAVLEHLRRSGHDVAWQAELTAGGSPLKVDVLVRDARCAVEVDGPSHHEPVWGEEQLSKARAADNKKNGLLVGAGWRVIRLRQRRKYLSRAATLAALRDVTAALVGPADIVHLEV